MVSIGTDTNRLAHIDTIRAAMDLVCRAPSLHNSQPWRWELDGDDVALFADRNRLLVHSDPAGRQMVLSCGAALHHARVVFAALGWSLLVERGGEGDHLATLHLFDRTDPAPRATALALAIPQRRSDRLPFAAPIPSRRRTALLRDWAGACPVDVDVLAPDRHAELTRIAAWVAQARRDDVVYEHELRSYTGNLPGDTGVPLYLLPSDDERVRVPVGRGFPLSEHESRRPQVTGDNADVLVLRTGQDTRSDWLRSGEALSAILLEATNLGLASCALTHLTELPGPRAALARLCESDGRPQILVRVGVASDPTPVPITSRRAVEEVFTVRSR